MTCCADEREIFFVGGLVVCSRVGESWDWEEEEEIQEERVGRVGIY